MGVSRHWCQTGRYVIAAAAVLTASIGTAFAQSGDPIKIGFSMATLKEERWQRDHDAFQAHCTKLNIECVITVANGDASRQANDVDNLLTRGIDVLVIAPHDATQAASMVDKAKAQNIPVVSYDRLINSDKIDLYVSHQVPVIGRKMAEFSLDEARRLGFTAMQFNFVVKSNTAAVRLWQSIGMEVIGEIPDAFDHRELGLTNAYVMYRKL